MNTNISHARIHGLDVLRCLSMFYVVILHILAQGKGGSLDASFVGASNYAPSWLLNFGALCAVNCFALFEIFQSLPWYGMMLAVLAGSLAIYLSCSLIDYIRSLLFRLLNISSLSQKLEQILIDIKNKLIHFIP